jgi:5'-nucleotidase
VNGTFSCVSNQCLLSCESDADCCPYDPAKGIDERPKDSTGKVTCSYTTPGQCCPGQCFQQDPTQPGICQAPVSTENVYQLATNNYIAAGGSGYRVLQRNTTQVNTQILQRDSLIDFMRDGHACGYDISYQNESNLQPCSVDGDCTIPGSVCACPAHVSENNSGGVTSCSTAGSCDMSVGRCVRQACRDQVANFHNQLCSGLTGAALQQGDAGPDAATDAGGQLVACQTQLNACSIAGEECKTLACVDSTEGAVTDNRVVVLR